MTDKYVIQQDDLIPVVVPEQPVVDVAVGEPAVLGTVLVAGPAGATGATGATGPAGPVGAVGPAGASGTNGLDGKTVRSGSGEPSAGLGVNGDFYINTAANTIYGPKASGAWGSPTSLVGAAGPVGATGATGATGVKGDKGDPGTTEWSGLTGTPAIPIPAYIKGFPGWAGPQGANFFTFNEFGEFVSLAGYGIMYDGNVSNTAFTSTNDLWLTSGKGVGGNYNVNVQASGGGRVNVLSVLGLGDSGATIRFGTGSPEGVVAAATGSIFLRTDGGPGSTFYVKESGSGSSGWAGK